MAHDAVDRSLVLHPIDGAFVTQGVVKLSAYVWPFSMPLWVSALIIGAGLALLVSAVMIVELRSVTRSAVTEAG